MRLKNQLLILLCMLTSHAIAGIAQDSSLKIGDPIPPLQVKEWLKGGPIEHLDNGRIHVVEFWATWCKPCIAAMPRLSALAREHKDKVTVIGVDVHEKENITIEEIKSFVNGMGDKMDYPVAIDDGRMVEDWLVASGEKTYGIPRTFVVDAQGRLAWTGHPKDLDAVIGKMVNGNWNISEALASRNEKIRMESVENEAGHLLMPYPMDESNPFHMHSPDSTLSLIAQLVNDEPKLDDTYTITLYKFLALLRTDQRQALDYGKELLASKIADPHYSAIIQNVRQHAANLNFLPEIYQLAAEAKQQEIDNFVYPEILDLAKDYNQIAEWHWRANDAPKAAVAQQKAIAALKNKPKASVADMAAFESRLEQYRGLGLGIDDRGTLH